MKFSNRARWAETERHPECDPTVDGKTYRGRRIFRRSSSVYPVHLGG